MTRRSTTFTSTCRLRRRKCSCSPLPEPPPTPSLCRQFRMALTCGRSIAVSWRKASSIRASLRTRACPRTLALTRFTPGHWALSAKPARTRLLKFVTRATTQLICSRASTPTRSLPIWLSDFPNLVPAGITPCPASQAVVASAVGRANCNQGIQRNRVNGGSSDYNALQTEFRANNLFKQLTIRTGYTFAKNLDNVSEIFATFGGATRLFRLHRTRSTPIPANVRSQVWIFLTSGQSPLRKSCPSSKSSMALSDTCWAAGY